MLLLATVVVVFITLFIDQHDSITSIEDVSLVGSAYLLPVTFIDQHQACPRYVILSFPACPEHVYVYIWALAHSALKAIVKHWFQPLEWNQLVP